MKSLAALLLASAAMIGTSDAMAAPNVVVSIKPIHSLVAAIMEGVAEPKVIVDGGASPHTYSLKPSNAKALENADVVFWVATAWRNFSKSRWSRWPAKQPSLNWMMPLVSKG